MKLIHALLDPSRLDAVIEALGEAEIYRLTITEVEGVGHQRESAEIGGKSVAMDFLPRIRLEIAVNEPFVEPALAAIRRGSGGGDAPGVILVFPLADVVRIRTGERGEAAI